MFAALQFPFCDVRRFVQIDTKRLKKPAWPLPNAGTEFIRSFGAIRRRWRGGIIEWPGEEMYCEALRALRFNDATSPFRPTSNPTSPAKPFCAFRRFLADGCAAARYEVGFGFRHQGKLKRLRRGLRRSQDFIGLCHFILSQEVSFTLADGTLRSCELIEVDHVLAEQYLRASTSGSSSETPEKWWLSAGTPLLLIEYSQWSSPRFPKHVRTVDSQILKRANLELSHLWIGFKGRTIPVWLLGWRYFHDFGRIDQDLLRRLRLSLFRIHSERETIRIVLSLIAAKKIQVTKDTEATDELQRYLNRAVRILSKRSFDGLPQSEILDVAYHAEDLITEGERATLLSELANIRRNVLNNVARFTSSEKERVVYQFNDAQKVIVVNQSLRRETVNSQTVNITNSTVGDINQVAAQAIRESFNKTSESAVSNDLKNRLLELNAAVAEMCKQLSDQQQKEAAGDLKLLTEEVTSGAPRPKWYQLSAEGLMEAAKSVGEMASPVITAVTAILSLLGGS